MECPRASSRCVAPNEGNRAPRCPFGTRSYVMTVETRRTHYGSGRRSRARQETRGAWRGVFGALHTHERRSAESIQLRRHWPLCEQAPRIVPTEAKPINGLRRRSAFGRRADSQSARLMSALRTCGLSCNEAVRPVVSVFARFIVPPENSSGHRAETSSGRVKFFARSGAALMRARTLLNASLLSLSPSSFLA